MASLSDSQYINFRNEMLKVKAALSNIKEIKSIYYPGENNNDPKSYEGNLKAIDDNLKIIKQSEFMIFVYPRKLPTSMLLEIGYGIALSKRIIIYTPNRDILPFLLKDADGIIKNITIHTYSDYDNLIDSIISNGLAIFK